MEQSARTTETRLLPKASDPQPGTLQAGQLLRASDIILAMAAATAPLALAAAPFG